MELVSDGVFEPVFDTFIDDVDAALSYFKTDLSIDIVCPDPKYDDICDSATAYFESVGRCCKRTSEPEKAKDVIFFIGNIDDDLGLVPRIKDIMDYEKESEVMVLVEGPLEFLYSRLKNYSLSSLIFMQTTRFRIENDRFYVFSFTFPKPFYKLTPDEYASVTSALVYFRMEGQEKTTVSAKVRSGPLYIADFFIYPKSFTHYNMATNKSYSTSKSIAFLVYNRKKRPRNLSHIVLEPYAFRFRFADDSELKKMLEEPPSRVERGTSEKTVFFTIEPMISNESQKRLIRTLNKKIEKRAKMYRNLCFLHDKNGVPYLHKKIGASILFNRFKVMDDRY